MDECIELLCSHQKLQRDKAIDKLSQLTSTISDSQQITYILDKLLLLLADAQSKPWETLHGALSALSFLYSSKHFPQDTLQSCADITQRHGVELLHHDEFRVRIAAGELLAALCSKFGTEIYERIKDVIIEMIENNLERMTTKSEGGSDNEQMVHEIRRSTSMEIFHDTAGWKYLETTMKCLQCVISSCGKAFIVHIDTQLLELLFVCFKHTNRFVRETGYYVLESLVLCMASADHHDALSAHGQQLSEHLATGLADNWSQVRMAASQATRSFLMSLCNKENRATYLPHLLPRMCLNRYYVAEGVRLYSQESWKLVTGSEGKQLVERFISPIVKFYINETEADNHAVREAACACIAELGSKINCAVTEPYVADLLKALIVCFEDDSWPVRDAACLAAGNFIMCFPDQSRSSMATLYPLFFENLQDNIASVRQRAALALANIVRAYDNEALAIIKPKIVDGLSNVKQQPAHTYKQATPATSNVSTFGVIKHLRDNDVSLHTNQPMYSCGSLAPKMARGGGCMDHQFRRPTEPWETADGCVHLIAELSSVPCCQPLVEEVLAQVAEAVNHKHYAQHVLLLESVCKRLPQIAKDLGKRTFKQYLELFLDSMFYALQVDSALTEAAAHTCLTSLSNLLGPNILRARIEMHNGANVRLFDQIFVP